MVTIVDYGMGNLHSVLKAFKRLQIPAQISSDPEIYPPVSINENTFKDYFEVFDLQL